jgi:hypothetical protein
MNNFKSLVAGLLLAVFCASPVLAAADAACLQNNRIWGWQALDQRTLLVTDRQYNKYTVHLTGGCINLDKYVGATLLIRGKTELGCVSQGDRIAFDSPGIGPQTCFVTTVQAGAPAKAPS